ncbi:hypothetical protein D3C86_965810 [compost metagenome]
MNSCRGTAVPWTVSNALGIGGGTSPSGKTKLLPGSNDTIALTLSFLMAVSHPGPPPCEWVKSMAGPSRSSTAETPSATTFMSNGPVFGVIARKNWLSVWGLRSNCTPSK